VLRDYVQWHVGMGRMPRQWQVLSERV